MFSVIIPLYNKAAHIEKAMRSVLNQSYHEFELIIVNDGSTDDSMQVVNHYLHSQQKEGNNSLVEHVRIINQPNAGVSTARNVGVQEAKYDYIAFLDADDWWHKHYLAKMKDLIEEHPEAKLYSASYYQVKRGQQHKATIGVDDSFKAGYIDYCEVYAKTLCMPVWTSAAIISKKAYEEFHGMNPAIKLGEDFDLWIRIALKYKVAFLNQSLAYYNHDVEQENRAVVYGRVYPPHKHFIFNLGYLESEERENASLKKLLDALRVYVLHPYYLDKSTRETAHVELMKVDWENQPMKERIRYKIPVSLLQLQFRFMRLGSITKQYILKHTRK
jgi:glycosyltransferase involved in cell wall biosynthesis